MPDKVMSVRVGHMVYIVTSGLKGKDLAEDIGHTVHVLDIWGTIMDDAQDLHVQQEHLTFKIENS